MCLNVDVSEQPLSISEEAVVSILRGYLKSKYLVITQLWGHKLSFSKETVVAGSEFWGTWEIVATLAMWFIADGEEMESPLLLI